MLKKYIFCDNVLNVLKFKGISYMEKLKKINIDWRKRFKNLYVDVGSKAKNFSGLIDPKIYREKKAI